jgi:hypothetical protein
MSMKGVMTMTEHRIGVVECERSPRLIHRCRDGTAATALQGELCARQVQEPGRVGLVRLECSSCELVVDLPRARAESINKSLISRAFVGARLVVDIGEDRLVFSRSNSALPEVSASWRQLFDIRSVPARRAGSSNSTARLARFIA